MNSRELSFILSDGGAESPKYFVGQLQMFSDQTLSVLKILLVLHILFEHFCWIFRQISSFSIRKKTNSVHILVYENG